MLHLLAILVSFVLSAIVSPAAAGTTGPPALVGVPTGSLPLELPLPADWGRLWIDWAGGSSSSGAATWQARTDAVNAQNQITSMQRASSASGAVPPPQAVRYDGAGNLTFDGTYAYQYDAWNRLVQVNAAYEQTPGAPNTPVVLDRLLKHHTYDGLGRLVRTLCPRAPR